MKTEKIRVYLIARISKDAHLWNNKIAESLNTEFFDVFKPHEHNPWNKEHKKFPQKVVSIDVQAIDKSHFGLALPEFGRDCAWETGYYSKSEKPLVFFMDTQTEWLRDWMIKGGLDYVITNNEKTYQILLKDPILKHKDLFLIKELVELKEIFLNLYKKHYGNENN